MFYFSLLFVVEQVGSDGQAWSSPGLERKDVLTDVASAYPSGTGEER